MYIPKGKIENKQYYTYGGEFQLPDGSEYIGFYHKDTFGNNWTEKEHSITSIQLINSTPSVFKDQNSSHDLQTLKYNKINQTSNLLGSDAQSIPKLNFFVTTSDYTIGYKRRYFIKYNASTQLKFDEISSDTYKSLKLDTSKYHTIMYNLVSLMWRVRGPLEDQYKNNILIKPGVYSSNQRSVSEAEKTCPGISLYLVNLTEGAIIEP